MKVLELFSGFASFSMVAKEYFNAEIFTIDLDPKFNPSLVADISTIKTDDIPLAPDVIWASPPCNTFSVAAFQRHHRDHNTAKSEQAQHVDMAIHNTFNLISQFEPRFWIIENPVGLLRKMDYMSGIPRITVTYCQYGDMRMKPTDLFGQLPSGFRPKRCKNGSPCHERAPRGSKKGTQRLEAANRARVPFELCYEILSLIYNQMIGADNDVNGQMR